MKPGNYATHQTYADYKTKAENMVLREARDLKALLEGQSLSDKDKNDLRKIIINLFL